MKEILIGMISGTVAALGMGGGTVLILLFGIFSSLDQHLIQGTNLIFFIPTSITAIIMNVKNKTINYKMAFIISLLGCIGAIIGSKLSFKFDSKSLKKYFGIFLLVIAAFEIYSMEKKNRIEKRRE